MDKKLFLTIIKNKTYLNSKSVLNLNSRTIKSEKFFLLKKQISLLKDVLYSLNFAGNLIFRLFCLMGMQILKRYTFFIKKICLLQEFVVYPSVFVYG